MKTTEEKAAFVIAQEEAFVQTLALQVLDRPKLSIWMILIPVIFVYFFYRYQKFNSGRKVFCENYLISRKRALKEALEVIRTGRKPDINALAQQSSLPHQIRKKNAAVLKVLVDHYIDLMTAEGENFQELIRGAYKNKTNFLLFINQLNQAEKTLNSAIEPYLAENSGDVSDIIHLINLHSDSIRKELSNKIFK
jgi:hypothetical protein